MFRVLTGRGPSGSYRRITFFSVSSRRTPACSGPFRPGLSIGPKAGTRAGAFGAPVPAADGPRRKPRTPLAPRDRRLSPFGQPILLDAERRRETYENRLREERLIDDLLFLAGRLAGIVRRWISAAFTKRVAVSSRLGSDRRLLGHVRSRRS